MPNLDSVKFHLFSNHLDVESFSEKSLIISLMDTYVTRSHATSRELHICLTLL